MVEPEEELGESDIHMSDGHLTDPESFTIDKLTRFEELDRDLIKGDYVLVKFKALPRKKSIVFYVWKLIKYIDDDGD